MTPGELCQRCGLCCDGTLFSRVPVGVSEQVDDAGLHLIKGSNGLRFVPLCCAKLEGTACGAYLQRPQACRAFECRLFGAVRDGEVSFDDAVAVVEEVKRLRLEKGAVLGPLLARHFGPARR